MVLAVAVAGGGVDCNVDGGGGGYDVVVVTCGDVEHGCDY